ncbi:3-aminobutyryl-CoA ammonia lyase [Plantactinospora sonchi]|uniref:Hotdog domain-containing protein n=1 Tax=Plantactinospora sonchi TaxID=1544735 RepID=A0ABU7RTY3_9ACTN
MTGQVSGGGSVDDPRLGLSVTHRRYVPYGHAHYAGSLVDGAYALGLFGDAATEVCIRADGDEGLFAGYSDVRFLAPVRAGDVVEVVATVTRVGTRSRTVDFVCRVVCRGRPDRGPSAAEVVDPPLVAVTAVGTVVVPVGAGSGADVSGGSGPATEPR